MGNAQANDQFTKEFLKPRLEKMRVQAKELTARLETLNAVAREAKLALVALTAALKELEEFADEPYEP